MYQFGLYDKIDTGLAVLITFPSQKKFEQDRSEVDVDLTVKCFGLAIIVIEGPLI